MPLEFVSTFLEMSEASAVIGTEITIFEPLAVAFAEAFLPRFLAGMPLGAGGPGRAAGTAQGGKSAGVGLHSLRIGRIAAGAGARTERNMVTLPLIGSAAMGLAWGWLLGLLHARAEKPARDALLLLGATVLAAVEVFLFVDWVAAVVFVGTAALAWLIHKLWLDAFAREKSKRGLNSDPVLIFLAIRWDECL